MTSFRIFQRFYNILKWFSIKVGMIVYILRCDIVSISQLEGSLEYQFVVLGMIPKKITFLVILWFGISDLLDFEIIGEEASIDVM